MSDQGLHEVSVFTAAGTWVDGGPYTRTRTLLSKGTSAGECRRPRGLAILCGVVMLARPMLGLASLTMVLAIYFLVDGVFEIIAAFKIRGERGWFWLILGGIVSLVLAYFIWREWPVSGTWAVGILVGIRLIFAGWSMIALGGMGEAAADEVEGQVT